MRQAPFIEPAFVYLDSDWSMVERALPLGWQAKAHELGVIQRWTGLK